MRHDHCDGYTVVTPDRIMEWDAACAGWTVYRRSTGKIVGVVWDGLWQINFDDMGSDAPVILPGTKTKIVRS